MLEALAFVPRSITDSAHIIRRIRNDFAHNLERATLSQIDKKLHRQMEELLKRVYGIEQALSPLPEEELLVSNFKKLSFVAILGLEPYALNCESLRKAISSSEFIDKLQRELLEEFDTLVKEAKARGPKSVQWNGSQWEIEYDCFVEMTDTLPENIQRPKADEA